MRIVGGKFRGRVLAAPKGQSIRPTTDRNRESLFNILNHAHGDMLDGALVLDIFAGTGALGLEALSRGATHCTFMEISAEGRGLLRQNVEALGLSGITKILRRDATKPGQAGTMGPFNLVFADPPYGKGLGEKALAMLLQNGWLAKNTLVVLEEAKGHLPPPLEGFDLLDQRAMGETEIGFFRAV
ncbi:MAG: 16S rRNA (guanine(966)-N(2))-methyltransferase RsmD [Pseudomonadota bacterium]